jgi:hypothetical protein
MLRVTIEGYRAARLALGGIPQSGIAVRNADAAGTRAEMPPTTQHEAVSGEITPPISEGAVVSVPAPDGGDGDTSGAITEPFRVAYAMPDDGIEIEEGEEEGEP